MAFKMKGYSPYDKIKSNNRSDGRAGSSAFTKNGDVDPDAPGTPGEPGFEPPVISKADKSIIKQMENELQAMDDPMNSNRGKSLINRIKKIDPEWRWGEQMPEQD